MSFVIAADHHPLEEDRTRREINALVREFPDVGVLAVAINDELDDIDITMIDRTEWPYEVLHLAKHRQNFPYPKPLRPHDQEARLTNGRWFLDSRGQVTPVMRTDTGMLGPIRWERVIAGDVFTLKVFGLTVYTYTSRYDNQK